MKRFLFLVALAAGAMALLAAPALASAHTFYVSPGGSNDTAAIQAAFNAAVKAGPGSTVQLSVGRFHTNTVFVKGFVGNLKGAGEGKTVIDTVAGVPVSIMPAVEPFPFLFGFKGGNVSVSGMSCDITAASPAENWSFWGSASTALWSVFLVTGSASSSFDQVNFTAGAGDDWDGYNVQSDIQVTGTWNVDASGDPITLAPTSGVDSVMRCSFAGDFGIWTDGLTAGRLTVGGSAAQGNVFNEFEAGCIFTDNSNSDIAVSHNRMKATHGDDLIVWQSYANPYTPPPPLPAPRYVISENNMVAANITSGGSVVYGAGGVWVEDDSLGNGDTPRLNAVIKGNDIHLDNGGYDAGVDGFWAQGIQVLDNRIWGTGLAGIDAGATWYYGPGEQPATSGWRIIGNDVSGVIPTDAWVTTAAPIWLGPNASHCLVVGGEAPTRVLDQGTDDTLINVSPVSDPPVAATPQMVPLHLMGQRKRIEGLR